MNYYRGQARLSWLRWLHDSGWYSDERIKKEMEDLVFWYFKDKEYGREKN